MYAIGSQDSDVNCKQTSHMIGVHLWCDLNSPNHRNLAAKCQERATQLPGLITEKLYPLRAV